MKNNTLGELHKRSILIPLQIAWLLLAGGSRLMAGNGNDTWSGGGGDNNWGTAANWANTSANQPPISGDALYFAGSTQLTANNNLSGFLFNGLNFNPNAGSFTLTGNFLTNTGAIIDDSPNPQVIVLSLALPATESFYTANGGSMLIGGVISGAGGINIGSVGKLTLTNNNTYAGTTAVNAGTLTLDYTGGAANNIVSTNSALSMGGATLVINGPASGSVVQTFKSLTINPINPGANFIIVSNNANNGASGVTVNLGVITPGSSAPLTFIGPATVNAAGQNVPATATITTTTEGLQAGSGLGLLAQNERENSWATVGYYDFATTDLPSGTAGTSPYTIIGGSQVAGFYVIPTNGNDTLGSYSNVDIAMPQTPLQPLNNNGSGEAYVKGNYNVIRFNNPQAPYGYTGNTTGNNCQVGAILMTPNMGPVNAAIDQIRMIADCLQVFQFDTNAVFTIGSIDDSNGGAALVKSGGGTLFINPITNNIVQNFYNAENVLTTTGFYYNYQQTSFYTAAQAPGGKWYGAFFLYGGATVINSNNIMGDPTSQVATAGAQGTVNLNGGTLVSANNNMNLYNPNASANRPVFIGGNGGGLAAENLTTLSVAGVISNSVAGAGPLTIGIAPSGANSSIPGLVPGTGGTNGTPPLYATGTVALTGQNTYTGGTIVLSGTLQVDGINNLGGTTANNGIYGGLILDGSTNGGGLQYAVSASGAGSLDLTSAPGITLASGNGTIDVNGNNVTYSNQIGNGAAGGLIVFDSIGAGSLNLSAASTYTGGTIVSNGATLMANNTSGSATGQGYVTNDGNLGGTGTIACSTMTVNGTNGGSLTINSPAVLVNGTLGGNEIVNASVTVQSGGQTLPNGGTNTINGNLTYLAGASANFVVANSATNGANDEIVVSGSTSVLIPGGVSVGIVNGPFLDGRNDYVLFNLTGGAHISGSFNSTPVWLGAGGAPLGAANFAVQVKNGTQVLLHYTGTTPPTITAASVTPNSARDFQSITLSASVTPGAGTINPDTGVTANLIGIGGSANQPLISNGQGQYTNTVVISGATVPGTQTIVIDAVDSNGAVGGANVGLTIIGSETWNGGDSANSSNWGDAANWLSGFAPGAGDNVVFAGNTGLSPIMDSSYSIASVTFSNNAGSFNIGNANGSILALTAGVTNNSANSQTLNVPLVVNSSKAMTLNAAAGALIVDQPVDTGAGSAVLAVSGANPTTINAPITDNGGLSVAGAGGTTLTANNPYLGATTVNAGSSLTIADPAQLGSGDYGGAMSLNGTLNFASSTGQTWEGVLTGNGALNVSGPVAGSLTLTGASGAYAGPVTISGPNAQVYLSGPNSFTGLNNGQTSIGTNQVTLANGGSLYMNGYNGPANAATGTFVNPILVSSNSVGNLFTLQDGAYTGNVTVYGTLNLSGFTGPVGNAVPVSYTSSTFGPTGPFNTSGLWSNSTGTINVVAGAFILNNATSGQSFGTATLNMASGTQIINGGDYSPTFLITLGGLTGSGYVTSCNWGDGNPRRITTYSVGGNNTPQTFSGIIEDYANGANGAAVGNGAFLNRMTAITKVGTGAWTLAGNSLYSGNTTISNGSLIIEPGAFPVNSSNIIVVAPGLLDVSSYNGLQLPQNVTVTLSGNGVVTGLVTSVPQGGLTNTISPGVGSAAGTLTFSNSFTDQGGTFYDFNLSSDPTGHILSNSLVSVSGGLTLAPQSFVQINPVNAFLGAGAYTLFQFTGNLVNENGQVSSGTSLASDLALASVGFETNADVNLTFTSTAHSVVMSVTPNGKNLVWQGNTTSTATNNWDLNLSPTWLNGTSTAKFLQYDSVTFNNTGNGNSGVILAGTLAPSSIAVNSTANYLFSGSGSITGPTGLTQSGSGSLTLSNTTANTYTGATTVNAGILALAGTASIATSPTVNVVSGAQLKVSGLSATSWTLASGQSLVGAGTITGNLTTAFGSTITPGASGSGDGTLTVTGTATLGGNIVMDINNTGASSELIAATNVFGGTLTVNNIGGALAGGNSFQLFSSMANKFQGNFTNFIFTPSTPGPNLAYGFNTNSGVLSIISKTPTNISYSVTGTNLNITWPADHTGWYLQVSTNSLNNWVTVPGSSSVDSITVSIGTNGSVFYRIYYP